MVNVKQGYHDAFNRAEVRYYLKKKDFSLREALGLYKNVVSQGRMRRFSSLSFHRLSDDREQHESESSLSQLLRTEQMTSPRRYNDYGGSLVNPAQVFGQVPRKSKRIQVSHHVT